MVNFLALYYLFTTYLKKNYLFHENITINGNFFEIGN